MMRFAAGYQHFSDGATFAEIVTTASPFIARTFKKAFPEIEVRASVNMRLTTLQAFKYLAPLFDSYYLGRDVQRNLETVKRFSGWCRANGKKLCILANSGCLRNCPWQTYHDNLIAPTSAADSRATSSTSSSPGSRRRSIRSSSTIRRSRPTGSSARAPVPANARTAGIARRA